MSTIDTSSYVGSFNWISSLLSKADADGKLPNVTSYGVGATRREDGKSMAKLCFRFNPSGTPQDITLDQVIQIIPEFAPYKQRLIVFLVPVDKNEHADLLQDKVEGK
jgi:hypothetical protein